MISPSIILIVDDLAANRETLLELLDSKAYRLVEAASGPEALKLAAESPPDVVLLDVMMPGMDGYEVCRRLRADSLLAEVPVIMITALDDQASRLAGIEAGADDFITKPFHSVELRARVRTITRLNRYRRLTEAQERIREQASLLDQARDAIIVGNLNDRITYWNKSAERLFGWTAEEAIGRSIAELLHHDTTAFQQARDKVIETGEWTGELQNVGKDGRNFMIESRWTLVRAAAGQPKGIMTINTDITERKRLAEQFLRAQRMESIGTLAGGIAHDLNNVLAPILMSIEILRMTYTDEDAERILGTIETSAQRGADLVRQVLTFARGVEGDRMTLQVTHLIKEIDKMMKETFPKSIRVRGAVGADLWPLRGDATQLHQVLMNLCVNARDAMPNGGDLTLGASNLLIDEQFAATHAEAKPGPFVTISVKDTGTGIPAPVLERMFEPFFSTKAPGKGTGLGLSTVRGIVKSHGGFMEVLTEVGKGTVFRVFLPVPKSTATVQTEAQERSLPTANGEVVLVVDDEAAILNIAKQTLEMFGYQVLIAGDGAQAIALCGQHSGINVMLTDMMMPIMDGQSTIKEVRRVAPQIKIIAATGLVTEADLNGSSQLKVEAFLQKPYTAERLLKTVQRVLRGEESARIETDSRNHT